MVFASMCAFAQSFRRSLWIVHVIASTIAHTAKDQSVWRTTLRVIPISDMLKVGAGLLKSTLEPLMRRRATTVTHVTPSLIHCLGQM